jgi:hypothetical protein
VQHTCDYGQIISGDFDDSELRPVLTAGICWNVEKNVGATKNAVASSDIVL